MGKMDVVRQENAGQWNRCLWGYLRYHVKWLFAVLLCGVMMTAIMILNRIPNEEILYGMLLCVVFLLMVALLDFTRYHRKYQMLQEFAYDVTVSLEKMKNTDEPVEAAYQTLITKLFEENMRRCNESLQREQGMMEYYTMWVHQIKTPIAALKLLLEQEGTEGGNAAEQAEKLQELFRIEQYAEMALQYMRLESESSDFVIKRTDLDAMVREAVHKYARQFIRKKISLDYDAVNQVVLTDEKWLVFVIEQILSNAIKYTRKGRISIYMESGNLVIADTGIGIRREDLPRVCEKGYTGYNGHADKRSTGIGLYLCSRILKKLGHTLTITSEEGKGTRVAVGFPDEQ